MNIKQILTERFKGPLTVARIILMPFELALTLAIITLLAIVGFAIWDNVFGPMIGKPYFKTFMIAAFSGGIVAVVKYIFWKKVSLLHSKIVQFLLWSACMGFLFEFFGK